MKKTFSDNIDLDTKVTAYLMNIRADLCSQGLSDEEADTAIAGALPHCIFKHVLTWKPNTQIRPIELSDSTKEMYNLVLGAQQNR